MSDESVRVHDEAVTRVWIVQSQEYDDESVVAVGASLDAAVRALHAVYPPPYVVEWDDPVEYADGWDVRARFTAVPGYSTRHTTSFGISEWTVAE